MFRFQFRMQFSWRITLKLEAELLLCCALALLATVNMPLCILLNALVPFFLVMLTAALALYSWIYRKPQDYKTERNGISILSEEFELLSEGKRDDKKQSSLITIQSSLHQMAYGSRRSHTVVSGEGKVHFMFALLFQRAEAEINLEDNESLIQGAGELLEDTSQLDERFRIFIQNFLHLLSMTLQDIVKISHGNEEKRNLSKHVNPLKSMKNRLKLDSFEVRFAFRLSLVLVAAFTISRTLQINHSYWLPLNAFLLAQPMYEDSTHRAKTRIIGTIGGGFLAFFVLSSLTGTAWQSIVSACRVPAPASFVPISLICFT